MPIVRLSVWLYVDYMLTIRFTCCLYADYPFDYLLTICWLSVLHVAYILTISLTIFWIYSLLTIRFTFCLSSDYPLDYPFYIWPIFWLPVWLSFNYILTIRFTFSLYFDYPFDYVLPIFWLSVLHLAYVLTILLTIFRLSFGYSEDYRFDYLSGFFYPRNVSAHQKNKNVVLHTHVHIHSVFFHARLSFNYCSTIFWLSVLHFAYLLTIRFTYLESDDYSLESLSSIFFYPRQSIFWLSPRLFV